MNPGLLKSYRPFNQCYRRVPKLCTAILLVSGLWISNAKAECTNDELPSFDSVQSLEQVFDAVAQRGTDQVIRAELTGQDVGNVCIWVYEVKLLSSSGKVTNVVYDASALRMIGFRAPQSGTEDEPPDSLLKGIGQRFGFFGRRDPSSEGRADSNRGDDGSSTASASSNGGSSTDSSSTDNADTTSGDDTSSSNGTASDSGPNAPGGSNSNTDGESGSSGSSSGGSSGGAASGGTDGSGASGSSSGSSN